MEIRFTHTCLIFDFENIDFDANAIYGTLLPSIHKILIDNNLTLPEDWILLFDAGYNNGQQPLVSKNRLGSYPSDKMKYIKIVIPIPLKSEIGWGVNPEQYLYGRDHYEKLMKNFWELDVAYGNYGNRTDYITACLKSGVKKAFEEGFTVGGVKFKAKKPLVI